MENEFLKSPSPHPPPEKSKLKTLTCTQMHHKMDNRYERRRHCWLVFGRATLTLSILGVITIGIYLVAQSGDSGKGLQGTDSPDSDSGYLIRERRFFHFKKSEYETHDESVISSLNSVRSQPKINSDLNYNNNNRDDVKLPVNIQISDADQRLHSASSAAVDRRHDEVEDVGHAKGAEPNAFDDDDVDEDDDYEKLKLNHVVINKAAAYDDLAENDLNRRTIRSLKSDINPTNNELSDKNKIIKKRKKFHKTRKELISESNHNNNNQSLTLINDKHNNNNIKKMSLTQPKMIVDSNNKYNVVNNSNSDNSVGVEREGEHDRERDNSKIPQSSSPASSSINTRHKKDNVGIYLKSDVAPEPDGYSYSQNIFIAPRRCDCMPCRFQRIKSTKIPWAGKGMFLLSCLMRFHSPLPFHPRLSSAPNFICCRADCRQMEKSRNAEEENKQMFNYFVADFPKR